MPKETKIVVRSTKEGKLYIEPSELFALESVQELIRKVVKSKVLDREGIRRVILK